MSGGRWVWVIMSLSHTFTSLDRCASKPKRLPPPLTFQIFRAHKCPHQKNLFELFRRIGMLVGKNSQWFGLFLSARKCFFRTFIREPIKCNACLSRVFTGVVCAVHADLIACSLIGTLELFAMDLFGWFLLDCIKSRDRNSKYKYFGICSEPWADSLEDLATKNKKMSCWADKTFALLL